MGHNAALLSQSVCPRASARPAWRKIRESAHCASQERRLLSVRNPDGGGLPVVAGDDIADVERMAGDVFKSGKCANLNQIPCGREPWARFGRHVQFRAGTQFASRLAPTYKPYGGPSWV